MLSTELVWTDASPPPMDNPPDFTNPSIVMSELRRIEDRNRINNLRSGGMLSHVWHAKWFVSDDFPTPNLANMSRWLLKDYDIDLGPQDLRVRIMPFDTFGRFEEARGWIEPFAPSTAYELARAARLMLEKDPLLMNDAEIENALEVCIRPLMEAIPYGTSVRDVFPKLHDLGLLPEGKGVGTGKARERSAEIGLLGSLALSNNGLIDGMFIPRRNKRPNVKTEEQWARKFNAYCKLHDLDRDDAFRRIMELAERELFTTDDQSDVAA